MKLEIILDDGDAAHMSVVELLANAIESTQFMNDIRRKLDAKIEQVIYDVISTRIDESMVSGLADFVLNERVDKVTGYASSGDNSVPRIEFLLTRVATETIKFEAAKSARYVAVKSQDHIRKVLTDVVKEMSDKNLNIGQIETD